MLIFCIKVEKACFPDFPFQLSYYLSTAHCRRDFKWWKGGTAHSAFI